MFSVEPLFILKTYLFFSFVFYYLNVFLFAAASVFPVTFSLSVLIISYGLCLWFLYFCGFCFLATLVPSMFYQRFSTFSSVQLQFLAFAHSHTVSIPLPAPCSVITSPA
ncbi:hypothetical protein ATANTOWER_004998 [Ataeniobius toweri]|uniref:Uncharacterized protein n=1 Tax=Ataeniobius toweri TaxID=208326 RepID=A0ABU7AD99_9TELE|nr:hypothetical protein [Ataeniobius toweri]